MIKKIALITAALMLLACAALAMEVTTDDIMGYYAFELDGVKIQLPTPMSTLLDAGWRLSDLYAGATLPAMSYDSTPLYKDSASISVTIVNETDAEAALEDCSLAGVMVFSTDGVPFSTDRGVSFDSTADEALAAYGLDKQAVLDKYVEGTAGVSVSFYDNGDDGLHFDKGIGQSAVGMNQIDLNFDAPISDNGKLESIQLRFMAGA